MSEHETCPLCDSPLTHGDCEYFCTNPKCLYVAGDDLHAAIRDMKAKLTAERDELREVLRESEPLVRTYIEVQRQMLPSGYAIENPDTESEFQIKKHKILCVMDKHIQSCERAHDRIRKLLEGGVMDTIIDDYNCIKKVWEEKIATRDACIEELGKQNAAQSRRIAELEERNRKLVEDLAAAIEENSALAGRNAELKAELSDRLEVDKSILSEKCDGVGEMHCTCVPTLRCRIAELEGLLYRTKVYVKKHVHIILEKPTTTDITIDNPDATALLVDITCALEGSKASVLNFNGYIFWIFDDRDNEEEYRLILDYGYETTCLGSIVKNKTNTWDTYDDCGMKDLLFERIEDAFTFIEEFNGLPRIERPISVLEKK